MKKLILAVFLFTATTAMITLSSQTLFAKSGGTSVQIPASQVPKPVKKNFRSMYPTAKSVQWEYEAVYYGSPVYTAEFYLGSQKWEADYNGDGTFISAKIKL